MLWVLIRSTSLRNKKTIYTFRLKKRLIWSYEVAYIFLFQVRAVKLGNVLVVDEADKAPTHVTCILKTLVESGEMHLADGRRIVSGMVDIKHQHL